MILRTYRGFLLTSHGVQRAILGIPAQRAPEVYSAVFCPTLPSDWGIILRTPIFSTKIFLAMLTESRAIVLRTIKYNDESFIAETLTEGHGRVSFLVRISRSPRAAVRHTLFQPLALLTICWNHREGNALKRPKSVGVSTPLVSIPYDPRKSAVALFLSEFLQAAIKVEVASELLFQYIYTSVEWFDTAPKDFANFHLVFLLHLVGFLGFAPNLEDYRPGDGFDLEAGRFTAYSPLNKHFLLPEDAARLPLLRRMNFATMHVFKFSGSERSRLLGYINLYYRLHLPSFPELKSLAVLQDLFDASR